MSNQVINQLNDLIGGAFALNPEAFQTIESLPQGNTLAFLVVLVAGLSLAVGQSIILFINQVRPLRFFLSLLLNAILFTFGFLFLVTSTWLIGLLPGLVQVPWGAIARVLGLSYAPLLFSFLGALPYAGVPILNVLSVWHLLAMVVGFSAITPVINLTWAFVHVALGWFTLNILEGTIGQPIAQLGQQIAQRVAGVELVSQRSGLSEKVQSRLDGQLPANRSVNQSNSSLGFSTNALDTAPVSSAEGQIAPLETQVAATTAYSTSFATVETSSSVAAEDLGVRLTHRFQNVPQLIRLGLMLLAMIVLFCLTVWLLQPIRDSLFIWHENLPRLAQRTVDLIWIGVVAIVFAGLLAPLETLGWWAGWFNDDIATHDDTLSPVSSSALPPPTDPSVDRYVIYVDGVGQSGQFYTPDVVDFIRALKPALPPENRFIQGLMMYSVRNQALVENRPLAWVWRLADNMRWKNPMALLGLMVNVRNAWIVAVSADQRYGPLYNQGIAQVLYNGLMQQGYQPESGSPITLIGYSGGAQMSVAAAPYLKRALGGEIDVISLGGVMSANNQFLKLGHLYHLVGDKDTVAGLGPFLFPGRRKWFFLSYWNRALRKGKISQVSLGPMGHQVPGGIMDPKAYLPSGQSHLEHTIAVILSILNGQFLLTTPPLPKQISHYQLYKQAAFSHYTYYPLNQTVDPQWYQPIAPWMGRLILPDLSERQQVRGVWFEVHHAARGYESLVGQTVMLRWIDRPVVKNMVRAVTRDVHFSVDAAYSSEYGGNVHPDRVNHWQTVGPLESLAAAHPIDDLMVMLEGEVQIEPGDRPILRIAKQPVEITGRYYALVQFVAPIADTDQFQVRHFNPTSRQFDGLTEVVRLPQVMLAQGYGSYPSTTHQLEQNPLNETGWYIYGAKDADGKFVVQSLAPRSLFRLQPSRVVFGNKASYHYIRQESWADAVAQKGQISSVLCVTDPQLNQIQAAIDDWQEGDRALLLHVYGGIGGNKKEPAAATPIFFGHFAYGLATVIRDPFTQDLRFEIQYYQIYTQNTDGLTAGTHHWSRYMGDRQFGWLGTRPVCDILIKFEPMTTAFKMNGLRLSALDNMLGQLQAMTARYRIGDGTGGTFVGSANNCSQDANQALFASIQSISRTLAANQPALQTWLAHNPEQGQQYQQLSRVGRKLRSQLQAFGAPRADWEANEFNLGTTLEDDPLRNLWIGLGSWRTLLPRKASDTVVQAFLEHGASVWVLRTNQVGGYDPDIEPIAPMTF
jgi:predicted Abi (CAAX) family protease